MSISLTDAELISIWLSLKVSFWATVWSMPLGIYCAWLLARREFIGKNLLNGLIHLPLVLPPVVVGYLLLISFGANGIVGKPLKQLFGLTFMFSWRGAALASAVVAFPLLVRTVRLSFESVDRRLEDAASTLRARPFRVFLTITLPLISPGILAGAILTFARSFGEFGATITFVSNIPGETDTLPIAIFSLSQSPSGDAAVLRLVLISVIIAMVALVGSEFINRRLGQTLHG
jgi:molybdate transport system permease protein